MRVLQPAAVNRRRLLRLLQPCRSRMGGTSDAAICGFHAAVHREELARVLVVALKAGCFP